jgi:hypothetical protein
MRGATTSMAFAAALGLAFAATAHAHAIYNLSGYGSGLAGSTNGADGLPVAADSLWTNGPLTGYVGGLPVNWYCGLHNATQVRTIQTGVAPNPPSGSLLQQVNSYNTANDPDLPADRVLAVGGLSWSDPANAGQGWGHGLDYGLIHVSPVDTILADGPVTLTITVQDDPSDGVAPQLAFALYGGWDTNAGSIRHQTFVTSPSPVNNPLGSTGLTLIDFAVATAPGQPLSRTYQVDATYGGEYTIFVAALGGVAGQYQVTAGLFRDTALSQCQTDLAAATTDADGDGLTDPYDICPETPAGEDIDQAGCSLAQYCDSFDATTKDGQKACKKADWKNDEPVASKKDLDCKFDKGLKGTPPEGYLCVPLPPPAP